MGGNIGIIVKKENGEQVAMDRWTNVMPYHFSNIELYLGNSEKWYEEFAEEWLKMKVDYEKHKDTGDYELNMTSVYFPHEHPMPSEYGIIAVDLKNKKIYSSQDYCNIGSLMFYNIWSQFSDSDENEKRIKDYFKHDLIKELQYFNRTERAFTTVDISSMTADETIQLIKEAADRKITSFSHPLFNDFTKEDLDFYSTSFLINSDWKFTIYGDRCNGVLKIKKELNQNGFTFTKEDDEKWKEYVSWHWEDYNEEATEKDEYFQEFKRVYQEAFNEPFVLKRD